MQKEKVNIRKVIKNYVLMTAACFCYAVAISLFLTPNELSTGGVTGIAIILSRVTSLNTGLLFLLLNIPILCVGAWKFGIKFIISTGYCTLLISFFTDALTGIQALTTDPLLAALTGAVLIAVGLGGVFHAGSTTGGMDIVVKLLRLKFPYMKTGALFLVADVTVVAFSALVFRDVEKALYAGITVFVTSFTLDLVLYGRDGAKLIYIISDKAEHIADRLLKELDIGVTYIRGQGAYSGRDKKVILCVMRKQLAPKAEQIIREEDTEAFLIITSATEIYGEGYKSFFEEKL
ncbi:MAG: YitT family protein [Lachnospiraceae bacterium]|nr:YitT family protein [Lachnospiraceae bacterium]